MSALYAAISGVQSSQKWLDVISNNVSNANTVGYKTGRVDFQDLVSQGLVSASGPSTTSNLGGIDPSQIGLGVSVAAVQTIFSQGSIQTTGNPTDVAINGNGFFTVAKGQNTYYTRAGNFTFDQKGHLVSVDGGLVQGWQMQLSQNSIKALAGSAANGTLLGTNTLSTAGPIGNITIPQNLTLAPQETSNNSSVSVKNQGVILTGNFDANSPQNASDGAGGVPWNAAHAANPAVPTQAQVDALSPSATSTFTTYDSLGNAHTILVDWLQVNNPVTAGAGWMGYAFDVTASNGQALGGAAVGLAAGDSNFIGTIGGASGNYPTVNGVAGAAANLITFNADGSLATNGAALNAAGQAQNPILDIPAALINANAVGSNNAAASETAANVASSVNLGTPNTGLGTAVSPYVMGLRDGVTGDYGNGTTSGGVYTPNSNVTASFVDGYSEGTLTSLSIDSTGGVDCTFSNNQTITVAKLALANFTNASGLQKVGNSEFAQTANSGLPQYGTAGANGLGSTQGGALESSNVDLTTELTNMIISQQMFQSNAKVITADGQNITSLLNAIQ